MFHRMPAALWVIEIVVLLVVARQPVDRVGPVPQPLVAVVHYFEDVTEVVENLRALLRPSGRIAVCVGTSHAAAPHLEPDTAVDDAGLRLRSPRLDADDLVEALEDAGYKRVSTKTRGDVLCAVGSR